MTALLQTAWVVHLGWTLIHFLWQGALVWGLYILLRRTLQNATPQARYCLALVAMLVLALLPMITFFCLSGTNTQYLTPPQLAPSIKFIPPILGALPGNIPQALGVQIAPFTSWTVLLWLAGVSLMSARALWGWRQAGRLRHAIPLLTDHPWQPLLQKLLESMHVKRMVRLLTAIRVRAPMVMGWLKPVILVPPSAVCGLTWQQAEMILAHELAHIRRHDYLCNLFQVAVETLLFYHPVVYWISQDARSEREFCCDDVVMETCGDRIGYLKALAELEGQRLQPTFGMGANGGALLRRAYRLAHRVEPVSYLPVWCVVLLTLTMTVAVTGVIHSHALARSVQTNGSPGIQTANLINAQSAARHPRQPAATHLARAVPPELAPTRIGFAPVARLLAQIASPSTTAHFQTLNMVTALPAPEHVVRQAAENPTRPSLNVVAAHPLPQPDYPYQALRDGLDGAVKASFRISETGDVRDIHTEMLRGPVALASAVRTALADWRFQPVYSGDKIISPRVSTSFVFIADADSKAQGHCVTFTGSHVCHWYRITIQDFQTSSATGNIHVATPASAGGNIANESVIVKLASNARHQPVFCQPDFAGCSIADSAEHRRQIEQQIYQLRAGFIPGY